MPGFIQLQLLKTRFSVRSTDNEFNHCYHGLPNVGSYIGGSTDQVFREGVVRSWEENKVTCDA